MSIESFRKLVKKYRPTLSSKAIVKTLAIKSAFLMLTNQVLCFLLTDAPDAILLSTLMISSESNICFIVFIPHNQ